MPEESFRGDPYRVLDLPSDSTDTSIKRRWRELAREHHPDNAAGDRDVAARLTKRMARINAAYDLLRDPGRRARFDSSPAGDRARARAGSATGDGSGPFSAGGPQQASGPPPPPPTRPVTARFDTSAGLRPRNATLGGERHRPAGYRPIPRPRRHQPDDLRASTPTGPVERDRAEHAPRPPTLREAREAPLTFGKFRGYTLGEVELLEPAYIDWIAQTITRDRDLVLCARQIQSEMDRAGVGRRARSQSPGFGKSAAAG
jgi:curved DNA-binding protein CbpA